MAKYKLVVSGWEIEASAQSLTAEQYEQINNHKEENDISTFHDMMEEIENIVEGYSRFDGNVFNFSGAIAYGDDTYLSVTNEDGEEVLSFVLDEIDFDDSENKDYNADPESTGHGCIIFSCDENKGTMYECEFDSEEEPQMEDFSFTQNYINTPEREFEVVEDFFFKGQKLEKNRDCWDTRGKTSETNIYTT